MFSRENISIEHLKENQAHTHIIFIIIQYLPTYLMEVILCLLNKIDQTKLMPLVCLVNL